MNKTHIFLLIFLISFSGCIQKTEKIKGEKPVERIVSISPEATEIIFALGQGDKLVGITSYCNYPQETKIIKKVGTFSRPSLEIIVSLKPDIVFAADIEQAPLIWKLKKLGIPVFVYCPESLEEIFQQILEAGSLLHNSAAAQQLVTVMKNNLIDTEFQKESNDIRPSIYIEISDKPYITSSKGSFIHELIESAGGINVAENGIRPFCQVSAETLVSWNPDIIVLAHRGTEDEVRKRPGWSKMNAVKNSFIYDNINPDILIRAGPRLIEGMGELRRIVGEYKKKMNNE